MSDKITLESALAVAAKPGPFTLTTIGGVEVFIHQMTAREVGAWWTWIYEEPKRRKSYADQLAELFGRLCVDENDKRLYTSDADVQEFKKLAGTGAALAEFYTEAKLRNFLYETKAEEDLARASFFTSQKADGETAATTSAAGSPSPEATPTT